MSIRGQCVGVTLDISNYRRHFLLVLAQQLYCRQSSSDDTHFTTGGKFLKDVTSKNSNTVQFLPLEYQFSKNIPAIKLKRQRSLSVKTYLQEKKQQYYNTLIAPMRISLTKATFCTCSFSCYCLLFWLSYKVHFTTVFRDVMRCDAMCTSQTKHT